MGFPRQPTAAILDLAKQRVHFGEKSPMVLRALKEPLRMTSTLVVTTLSASIERSAWRKCPHKG